MEYTDDDKEKLVIEKPDNIALKLSLWKLSQMKNPVTDLYQWVKGEIYDLEAFQAAIHVRGLRQKKVQEITKEERKYAERR